VQDIADPSLYSSELKAKKNGLLRATALAKTGWRGMLANPQSSLRGAQRQSNLEIKVHL